MKKQRWLLLLAVICLLVALVPMVVSAEVPDGWFDNGNGTMSYYRDGEMVTNAVIEVEGAYYAFNGEGVMYDNGEFRLNDTWYRAKEGGALYVNEWFEDGENRFYYVEEGKAANDFVEVDGVLYYFFGDGMLATDCAVYSPIKEANYAISSDGTGFVELTESWNSVFGSWYYVADGMHIYGEVRKIGNVYYGFDWDGKMYEDQTFWCNGYGYCAKAGGALITNSWYYDNEYEIWYYFDAEAKGAQDFVKIGGVWYFFWYDGIMAQDTVVYSQDYDKYYIISKDGAAYVEMKEGWQYAFGSWYYAYSDGEELVCAENEILEIGGQQYYFDWDGKMVENDAFFCDPMGRWVVATPGGALLNTGWAKINGDWYYANEYMLYEYGVYEVDGAYYFFENGRMYDIPGEYDGYYVSASGALYRNAWRYDKTGYTDEIGWVYYGDDARSVYGIQVIGDNYYYFPNGHMATNVVRIMDNGVYVFGADGVGREVDGWFKDPKTDEWMYAIEGYLAEGILILGEDTYAFSDGRMVTETYYYGYEEATDSYAAYLFDAEGLLVTTPGWYKLDGSWYVVSEEGHLVEGWLKSGAVWYYLYPNMAHDTVFFDYEYNSFYAADTSGSTTALTGSGWRQLRWGRIYLEDGKPVINEWRKLNGAWYYFAENGEALMGDVCYIGDVPYLFDEAGKLVSGGWQNINGNQYYTDAAGVPVTGMQTIDGVQYLFSDRGYMYYGGSRPYGENVYWLGDDGRVLAQIEEGWNQIGGKWYYMRDYQPLRSCLHKENGVYYGFDRDGVMCTDGIHEARYDLYMFDKSGKILTGWQFIDGKWRYADPESEDPCMYTYGLHWIDDKEYCFDNGAMVVGTAYVYDMFVTTDASGVVIETTELEDGWNYTGSGYIYMENGEPYTGWVGNYYTEYGRMLYEQRIEYNGEYYYLSADGTYVRNGWYKIANGEYIYARANGALYCNEWLYQGGNYYYFTDGRMVYNGYQWIDGAEHEFDENGIWLGEVDDADYPSMSDGWHQIGGEWYYYHANTRLIGTYYIDGAWYAFYGEDGAMLANRFFDGFYYNASGARAAYTGWQLIDGYWVYFQDDYTVHYGWVKSGNGWYYTRHEYDENTERSYVAMITNEAVVEKGRLYYFNASGYCSGAVEGDGWYQAGGDWYYLENDYVVRDAARKIGGVWYYFDYDGKMMTNDGAYVEIGGRYGIKYFGASGAAVNTAGWIQHTLEDYDGSTRTVWLYVGEDGYLYEDGIYMINGVQYTFSGCIML